MHYFSMLDESSVHGMTNLMFLTCEQPVYLANFLFCLERRLPHAMRYVSTSLN